MTMENNQVQCPECGSALPQGALAGLCPACLLEAGDETQAADDPVHKRFQPPSLEEIARLFPQLDVQQLIGAGGMGAVYKAKQPALGRFVALKILPPGTQEGVNFAERFNREARALARLSHPSIVAVHEFGHVQGLHYFIMEYVDGTNLRQLQRAARLSPREAMQIIPQICDALQYAHDEGVVHRDIKPENILVDRKGRVKIADFGLAKVLGIDADQARLTAEGQVMGTPHYMAPEQVERPLAVDHRADIYSLGVVFYEMLTGDLPLGKFSPPSRKVSLDVRLDEVVLRALENDPERRYQHASEVKSELETITVTPPKGPAPTPAPPGKPVERHVYWAGIPLAVERDGEREIVWNGALTAIGIGFMLTAGGLLLTRLVTGQESPPLTGITFLITIFILGAGFRWALRAPLDTAEPKVTADGTVILEPKRRRFDRTYLALASILLAVFAWGLVRNLGLPALRQHLWSGVDQVARRDPATGILFADLPKSGRVELLGLSYRDAAPNQWWRPNGVVVTNEFYEIENLGDASAPLTVNWDIIFRVADLPSGASGPRYQLGRPGGYSSGGYVVKNGAHLHGASGLRVAPKSEGRSIDIRAGFGLEPYRTIASRAPSSQSTTQERLPGDPVWEATFHSITDTADGAQVTLVMNLEHRGWNWQLIAIDTNDVEHSFTTGSATPSNESSTWTCTFRGLPLQAVKDFRLQVQPVHWVEFRNIRLAPREQLPAAEPVKFGPVHEFTFSDYIDFDAGKTMEEPPGTNANIFEGMNETAAWMERTGIDAAAGNGELQPLGMVFAALPNEDWANPDPRKLTAKLHDGMFRPTALKPWKNGELPSTFGFRTREGGTGLLQLVGFEPDRPGVRLRYRLLNRPTPESTMELVRSNRNPKPE